MSIGDVEEDKYFFSKREDKYRNGNRSNRASASGYWKATGLDKHITFPTRRNIKQPIMGMRKTLVFYRGKHPHSSRSNWIMHEYRLLQSLNNQVHTLIYMMTIDLACNRYAFTIFPH